MGDGGHMEQQDASNGLNGSWGELTLRDILEVSREFCDHYLTSGEKELALLYSFVDGFERLPLHEAWRQLAQFQRALLYRPMLWLTSPAPSRFAPTSSLQILSRRGPAPRRRASSIAIRHCEVAAATVAIFVS